MHAINTQANFSPYGILHLFPVILRKDSMTHKPVVYNSLLPPRLTSTKITVFFTALAPFQLGK